MTRYGFAGISILAGISVLSFAQAAPLTWEQCVSRVAEANPELKAARATVEAAEFEVRASYGHFLPSIAASLSYDTTAIQAANRTALYSAAVTASQELFSGFRDRGQLQVARAALDKAQASFELVRSDVSFDLKSAFAGLTYAQASVKLSEDILRRRESNSRLVLLRFEGGRENRGSVLLAKAYFAQAKYDLVRARNSVKTAKAELARLMGQSETSLDLEVEGSVPLEPLPDAPVDIQEYARSTPALRISRAERDSAEAAVLQARSVFFPSFGLSASIGRSGAELFPVAQQWSVGASLSYPLFSGGTDFYSVRRASALFHASSLSNENAIRSEVARLTQALWAYQEAVERLEVDRAFMDAALVRERIAKEKYNNGLLSFEDWDLIESDLVSRQRTLLSSERDAVLAESAWQQARGRGLFP